MQPRDFFVKVFRQYIHFVHVLITVLPEFYLRQHLVRKRVGHDETRVAGSAAKIYEATFGEQDDALSVWKNYVVNLRFDVFPLVLFQVCDVNLIVEVADIADDGLIAHAFHLRARDNVVIAGGSHDDVDLIAYVVEPDDAIAFHRCLQCADRVDFGYPDRSAQALERLRAAFAHVSVSTNDRDLAGDHDVGSSLDTVDQRFATAVEIVELRFCDRIIDVESGAQQ